MSFYHSMMQSKQLNPLPYAQTGTSYTSTWNHSINKRKTCSSIYEDTLEDHYSQFKMFCFFCFFIKKSQSRKETLLHQVNKYYEMLYFFFFKYKIKILTAYKCNWDGRDSNKKKTVVEGFTISKLATLQLRICNHQDYFSFHFNQSTKYIERLSMWTRSKSRPMLGWVISPFHFSFPKVN